ncbi:MAG TPA: GNAT family N-acetyltransferase [Myxococcales bacterium]|nr:GNAT family N-acetyltransferase [Myxococcales bacterium]
MSGPLKVERVEGADPLGALAAEWRALFDETGCRLPFFAFEWAQAWWAHLRRDGRATRDSLRLRAIRGADGRLVGVAPVMLTERPAAGPLRARSLQFIGADGNLTEVRGILCAPGLELEAHAALRADLEADRGPWDWIHWSGVPPELADIGVDPRRLVKLPPRDEHVLELPESWDAFKSQLKRNVRESLRKCYNSLKRDSHEFTFRVGRTADEVAAALPRLFQLHSARAAVTDTIRHRDVFGGPREQSFMEAVCRSFAARDRARSYQLVIGGEVVAIRLGFQFGKAVYLYYSGYDPKWADYSVMTTCLAEALKHAIGEGITVASLSTGTDPSKTRWGGKVIARQEWIQHRGTARGRLAYGAVEALKNATWPRAALTLLRPSR